MIQSDLDSFKELIVGTAGAYGQYIPNETVALLFGDFKKFDLDEIRFAYAMFRKDIAIKKMPVPGEIIHFIISKRKEKSLAPFEDQEKVVLPDEFFKEVFAQLKETDEEKIKMYTPGENDEETWKTANDILELVKKGDMSNLT